MSRYHDVQLKLNNISPIPKGIPKIYLLGDTGAGKTTLIRKILGTDVTKFPTTRQTRTTVAPTEYVICNTSGYDLTVLFKSLDEVKRYVREIIKESIEKYIKNQKEDTLSRSTRQTNDQRFRLYYLLGDDLMIDFVERIKSLSMSVNMKIIELEEVFKDDITDLDEYVIFAFDELSDDIDILQEWVTDEIQKVVMSICENNSLCEEITPYKYQSNDKDEFIERCKKILASDKESISPVIEYARISGNIKSEWLADDTEVVIVDGEGIGHDTKEVGQLDARHYDFFYNTDLILLIEESKKPFVAGGKSALKSIFNRGYENKLSLFFTKLDEVSPYDIEEPTDDERIENVQDGLENVLSALKNEGDKGIKYEIDSDNVYYFGGLDKNTSNERLCSNIERLFNQIKERLNIEDQFIEPKYDFELLPQKISLTSKIFKEKYNSLLHREHWKTIEAFSLRMYFDIDGFRMFTPITDFEEIINEYVNEFLSIPMGWDCEAVEKLKLDSLNKVRREFNKLILNFIRSEIITIPHEEWKTSYCFSGRGSTVIRRSKINSIFKKSIPDSEQVHEFKIFKDKIKNIIINSIDNCKNNN
ncbi:hypothetical protein [Pectobacterium carotovorum]|uniref:hypothetical protein n=1 Tax=Pectobacterium carotovorum TaxID=554 RepID=UPI0021C33597|nr:hypothetical protein [Pectobacterium carotovorum]GKW07304.1 hypothetical protein PEC301889_17870 [Pectobacterium carotovorum subsp. carotovorum]